MIEKHEITRVSPLSRKTNTLTLGFDMEDYRAWQNGKLIQNAMPYLTPGEQEFLMTGITESEWDETFKK